mmetsp:Transcript_64010/g.152639  ORF Transcript_64010/g.152639 Transcript_64010/m.152639 type:complete len:299 (-) Transcript_64010:77-973(-)
MSNLTADADVLPLAFTWVSLSGMLGPRALLSTVRCSSATLKEILDTEAVWRQVFLQRYLDRTPVKAQTSWFERWRRRQRIPGAVGKADAAHPQWEAGVVFAGAPRSGKSWLAHRLCTGSIPEKVDKATILGTDLRVTNARLAGDEQSVGRIRLWEPSGASRKQTVLDNYFRKADAVIVFIDASEHAEPVPVVEMILHRVVRLLRKTSVLTLCCSKADKLRPSHNKQVSDLRALAGQVGAEFTLCSALTGEGVEELMCQTLSACREVGGSTPRTTPVLSTEAGTLSNSELLSALLLHRR